MTDLAVHPVADLFPMLAEDELAELAADIKQRGQLQPIVLDAQGRVLDGRNRLAACRLADVEPIFETYHGDDPDGYALAVNGQRREMTKRQKAVVGARMILLSNLDNKDQDVAAALGVSRSSLVEAIVVARHPDLADRVLGGTKPFSEALDDARERDRQKAEEKAAKHRLRAVAPDLLSLVDEERMSLSDAVALLDAREEKARREEEERRGEEERQRREQEAVERAHAARVSDTFRSIVGRILSTYHTEQLRADVVRHYADDLGDAMPATVDADSIREAGDYLHQIADEWKKGRQ